MVDRISQGKGWKPMYNLTILKSVDTSRPSSVNNFRKYVASVVPDLSRANNKQRADIPSVSVALKALHFAIPTVRNVASRGTQMER